MVFLIKVLVLLFSIFGGVGLFSLLLERSNLICHNLDLPVPLIKDLLPHLTVCQLDEVQPTLNEKGKNYS